MHITVLRQFASQSTKYYDMRNGVIYILHLYNVRGNHEVTSENAPLTRSKILPPVNFEYSNSHDIHHWLNLNLIAQQNIYFLQESVII
jgi:hypothetical protein